MSGVAYYLNGPEGGKIDDLTPLGLGSPSTPEA